MNNSYSGTDLVETLKDGVEEEEEGMVLSGPGPTSTVLFVSASEDSFYSGYFYWPGE